MNNIIMTLIWILLTLGVVLLASYLSKKYGEKLLVGFYSVLVVISAVTATKLITLLTFTVPAGVVVYAASFLITDLISEVYGKKSAITTVWMGFLAMIVYYLYALVTVHWSPAPYWENQDAYETIMNQSIRITLAGIVAFLVSQINDVAVFHYLKKKTHGKKLALRNIISTAVSQGIDTILFISIAFYGVFDIVPLIIGQYVIKLIIAFVDTPFVYLGRKILLSDVKKD